MVFAKITSIVKDVRNISPEGKILLSKKSFLSIVALQHLLIQKVLERESAILFMSAFKVDDRVWQINPSKCYLFIKNCFRKLQPDPQLLFLKTSVDLQASS